MAETVAGFEWDAGNWPKCGKHGVSMEEIEAVLGERPSIQTDISHSQAEARFLAIGRTLAGRHVFICFTIRHRPGGRYLRPISARYMRQKEINFYEEANS